MKKYFIQSGMIGISIIAILAMLSGFTYASTDSASNLIIGERAEEIDGMLHKVDYIFGSAMFTNIDSMLKNKNIELYAEDRISYFPDPNYGLGSKIIIKRANAIVINDGGERKTVRTWKTTVQEVLNENDIELGDKDVIDFGKDAKLSELAFSQDRDVVARDMRQDSPLVGEITITRVAETEIKEFEAIDFKTITKKDSNLEKGTTKIELSGKKGKKELIYLVRRENNQIISRELVKTNIIEEPIDKVILEGTKVVILGTGLATWYDLVGGMTAASNTLPHGTMVHVVNTENNRSVDVKIVDHGIQGGAVIDLSKEAFEKLSPLGKGVIKVRLEKP